MEYIIVGLGNPGPEYTHTRHNAGREAVETFVARTKREWSLNKKINANVARGDFGTAVLPNTYMNESGSAVMKVVRQKSDGERLIVVYDDIDLPIGMVRISGARGSGGHKGIESIVQSLKTNEFARIRIGVSKKGADGTAEKPTGQDAVVDFVLEKFSTDEREVMRELYERVGDAIDTLMKEGMTVAMNKFN